MMMLTPTIDVTYLPEVRCEVLDGGLIPNSVTAHVRDLMGKSQYINVLRGLINHHEGHDYLAVGFVQIDPATGTALVEFPVEADSGANRMWVGWESLWSVADQ
jgi:hypothetical protein